MTDPSVLVLGVGLLGAPVAFEGRPRWLRNLCTVCGAVVIAAALSPGLLIGAALLAGFALGVSVWVALGRL